MKGNEMTGFKPYLPGILWLIAEEVGEDVAIKLATERGGRAVHVPKNPAPDHVLTQLVGLRAAQEISDLCGAGEFNVPCGNLRGAAGRKARAQQLLSEGTSCAAVAADIDLSIRTVQRYRKEMTDDNQLKLPLFA